MKPTVGSVKRLLWRLLPFALIAAGAGTFALASDGVAGGATAPTKIRLRIGTRTLTATLAQNKTARDFVSLLPLTLSSQRTANLTMQVPVILIIAWAALWGVAAVIAFSMDDDSLGILAAVCFWIGLLLMIAGLVGRLVITRLVIPQAKVMEPQPGYFDKLVELRNVHPNFVQALHQQQVTRLAQMTTSP